MGILASSAVKLMLTGVGVGMGAGLEWNVELQVSIGELYSRVCAVPPVLLCVFDGTVADINMNFVLQQEDLKIAEI